MMDILHTTILPNFYLGNVLSENCNYFLITYYNTVPYISEVSGYFQYRYISDVGTVGQRQLFQPGTVLHHSPYTVIFDLLTSSQI